MPVCMPTGGSKQSNPPLCRSVCSQNPICCPMVGLPPDHVFKLCMAVKGHSQHLCIGQWRATSWGQRVEVVNMPQTAAPSAPRQAMLQVSGMSRPIPCPICKTATTEQAGTGPIGKSHNTIYLWSTEHPEWSCTSAWKSSWADRKPVEAQATQPIV